MHKFRGLHKTSDLYYHLKVWTINSIGNLLSKTKIVMLQILKINNFSIF